MLVLFTIGLTTIALFLWIFGIYLKECASAVAIFMWVMLIICYLSTIARLRKDLDELISKGEWISTRLTGDTVADIDKHELRLQEWDVSITKVLKGTEYENSWRSNVGLTKPEDESHSQGLERLLLNTQKNYVALRLTRLMEIKSSLRD